MNAMDRKMHARAAATHRMMADKEAAETVPEGYPTTCDELFQWLALYLMAGWLLCSARSPHYMETKALYQDLNSRYETYQTMTAVDAASVVWQVVEDALDFFGQFWDPAVPNSAPKSNMLKAFRGFIRMGHNQKPLAIGAARGDGCIEDPLASPSSARSGPAWSRPFWGHVQGQRVSRSGATQWELERGDQRGHGEALRGAAADRAAGDCPQGRDDPGQACWGHRRARCLRQHGHLGYL